MDVDNRTCGGFKDGVPTGKNILVRMDCIPVDFDWPDGVILQISIDAKDRKGYCGNREITSHGVMMTFSISIPAGEKTMVEKTLFFNYLRCFQDTSTV
jgi:hypothetical protein